MKSLTLIMKPKMDKKQKAIKLKTQSQHNKVKLKLNKKLVNNNKVHNNCNCELICIFLKLKFSIKLLFNYGQRLRSHRKEKILFKINNQRSEWKKLIL